METMLEKIDRLEREIKELKDYVLLSSKKLEKLEDKLEKTNSMESALLSVCADVEQIKKDASKPAAIIAAPVKKEKETLGKEDVLEIIKKTVNLAFVNKLYRK